MHTDTLDLTEGSLTPLIFRFSIPVILGSLIQTLFSMADQIVLGQMAGSTAVASVGACSMVVALVVNLFAGLSGGVTVVLARALGAKDGPACTRIISTAMIMSLGIGVLASAIAIPGIGFLLNITECPEVCRRDAEIYLAIYYSAIPAITVYNFGASILRVSGDTRRPTMYLTFAGLLNIVLNVILCILLEHKVAAVAIATMASQLLGAILTVVRLFRMPEDYRLCPATASFHFGSCRKILRYGIPHAFSNSLYCIANLQIQAGINSYGPDATCGNSACADIEGMLAAVVGGFNTATVAMVGQNLGAGKPDRVKKSVMANLLYSALITGVCTLAVFAFRRPLLGLYAPDSPAAVEYGVIRTYYVLMLYSLNAVNGILASTLNAFGHSFLVMCSSLATTVLFRPLYMKYVYPHYLTFGCIMFCFTIAWILTFLNETVMTTVVMRRYSRRTAGTGSPAA